MHTHTCAECGDTKVQAILDPHGPRCAPCIDQMADMAKIRESVPLDMTPSAECMASLS